MKSIGLAGLENKINKPTPQDVLNIIRDMYKGLK